MDNININEFQAYGIMGFVAVMFLPVILIVLDDIIARRVRDIYEGKYTDEWRRTLSDGKWIKEQKAKNRQEKINKPKRK